MEAIGFMEKIKGFLGRPIETFIKVKEETLGDALRYFIPLLIIYSLLYAIVTTALFETLWGTLFSVYGNIPGLGTIFETGGIALAATLFVLFLIAGLIGIFISGGIIHIGVLIVGGKKGYSQTVKAMIYGATPSYLFGWIPFIGIIFAIWTLILEIVGIKELQELSTGKAVLAILLPIIVVGILVFIAVVIYVLTTGITGAF